VAERDRVAQPQQPVAFCGIQRIGWQPKPRETPRQHPAVDRIAAARNHRDRAGPANRPAGRRTRDQPAVTPVRAIGSVPLADRGQGARQLQQPSGLPS